MADLAPTVSRHVLAAPASAAAGESRWRVVARTAFPFLVVAVLWEFTAYLGIFPRKLFPPLEDVAATFVRLTASGILPHHVLDTLMRLAAGFALAAVAGVAIGLAMGRSRRAEDIFLPLVSIGAPIPGLAYTPLFLLWFGLGNKTTVLLVGFVSAFPIIFNTWTGVKAVKEIWVRSAQAMGADSRRLFHHVILPGSLPYVLTGLRLGLAQAWRILVGVDPASQESQASSQPFQARERQALAVRGQEHDVCVLHDLKDLRRVDPSVKVHVGVQANSLARRFDHTALRTVADNVQTPALS